ncbi:MAG: (2Fe-2S)-binding protein [Micromonosporaceae bacterium]
MGDAHEGLPGETVTFSFDGEPMRARRGWSIGAALIANGVVSWRVTRSGGRPRGLFCGIGVCFDCLVDVNGVCAVRACLAPVHEGDRVQTSASLARVAKDPQ